MCQPSSSSQIKTGPIFASAVNIKRCAPSISLLTKKQQILSGSLRSHEVYLKTRLEKTHDYVSTKQLLKEITDRGYRGKIRMLQRFLSTIRTKAPKEASLTFHKEYLSKRVERLGCDRVVAKRLFEEIKGKGYQGAYKTVRLFLATIRTKAPKEASLTFHKDYLIKRTKESGCGRGVIKQLFEEIQAKGYQGAYKTVRNFLATMRMKAPKGASLRFHKDYLIKRIKESTFDRGLAKKLFEEIKGKGYQGALSTVQGFLSKNREKKKTRKTSLEFHKEYLKTRLEEALPNDVSTKQLLQEITDRGYRGSIRIMQLFLATIRANKDAVKTDICVPANHGARGNLCLPNLPSGIE